MAKKKTDKEFKKEVYNLVKDEYTFLGKYINTNEKILVRHNICGNEYMVTPNKFLQGKRCPRCNTGGNKSMTNKDFLNRVKRLTGDEYTFLEDYKGNDEKILVRHNICGNEYMVTPNKFNQGRRCPYCSGRMKKTNEEFIKEVNELVGDEYTILSEYSNNKNPVKIRHNKCNYIFEMSPHHFLRGHRCPNCYGTLKKTNEEFLKEVNELVGDEYTILEDYKNTMTPIKIRHNICGYEYTVSPNNFISRETRCPKCSKSKNFSKGEKELLAYIKKLLKDELIIENDKSILSGKEIDIYIPKFNLAIEYDGLYWHSEEYITKNYHLNKTEICNNKGIRLIHIFEDEWISNKRIVKDKIKTLLGLNTKKIYARECIIKEIDTNTKNEFLNKTHIQGKDTSSIRLGLYTNTKYYEREILVAVMTFCKPRKSLGQSKVSIYDYELSRYSSLLGYNIFGGFSKLLKYFERNYKWNNIITYADRRWSNGDVYLNNGFNLSHISKPNYWYINKTNITERYHRFNFRKGNLKKLFPEIYDETLTERDIMRKTNYLRIYDCGNYVFTYKNTLTE